MQGQKHSVLSPNEIPGMNMPKKKTDMFKRKKSSVNNLFGGGIHTSNNFQISMESFDNSPICNNQYHQFLQSPPHGQQQLMYSNVTQHISPPSANTTFSYNSPPSQINENILAVLKSAESTPIRRKQRQRQQYFTNETVQMNAQRMNTSGSVLLNNSGVFAIPIQNCPTPGNLLYTNGPYAFQPIYQQHPINPYHPVAQAQGYYQPRN